MVGQASSASEWQDMLSGRLPMREVRACGKCLAYDCLIGMSSSRYPYSVRALCMKLAYKLCLPHPELLDELKSNLEIMEPDLLPPSLRSVRCRVMVGIVSQKRG